MVMHFSDGFAAVRDDNGKWWKIDKTGKIVREIKIAVTNYLL